MNLVRRLLVAARCFIAGLCLVVTIGVLADFAWSFRQRKFAALYSYNERSLYPTWVLSADSQRGQVRFKIEQCLSAVPPKPADYGLRDWPKLLSRPVALYGETVAFRSSLWPTVRLSGIKWSNGFGFDGSITRDVKRIGVSSAPGYQRRSTMVTLPHWFVGLVFGLTAWWLARPMRRAWAARARRRRGLCPSCGYDLRGSPGGGPCPECGAVASSGTPATSA